MTMICGYCKRTSNHVHKGETVFKSPTQTLWSFPRANVDIMTDYSGRKHTNPERKLGKCSCGHIGTIYKIWEQSGDSSTNFKCRKCHYNCFNIFIDFVTDCDYFGIRWLGI